MSRIPRIYHPERLEANIDLSLESGAAQHVARVLRLGAGAELILFDGHGGHYPAVIVAADKRIVQVQIGSHRESLTESPLEITLAQGISKGERMDLTIQKSVELGVTRIIPLETARSVVRLKGERMDKKQQHWQGIIQSACEQSGRDRLPQLLAAQSLANWLKAPVDGCALMLDPYAEHTISELPSSRAVTLLIGPEGGLSDSERQAAREAGYLGIRLGPRILRTETAALTTIAVLQSRWGDLG